MHMHGFFLGSICGDLGGKIMMACSLNLSTALRQIFISGMNMKILSSLEN